MKYKIVAIKRRNFLERIFSIEHFKVTVELEDGRLFAFNAWAGAYDPDEEHLKFSVRQFLHKTLKVPEYEVQPKKHEVDVALRELEIARNLVGYEGELCEAEERKTLEVKKMVEEVSQLFQKVNNRTPIKGDLFFLESKDPSLRGLYYFDGETWWPLKE